MADDRTEADSHGVETESSDEDRPGASSAGDLDERLAEIHRRTEELAERVASFRSETAEFAATQTGAGERANPADDTGAEPDAPQRRHRPRPSAAAPVIFDDAPDDEPEEKPESKPDEKPAAEKPAAEKPAAEKPAEKPAETGSTKREKPEQPEKREKRASRGMPKWARRLRTLVIVVVIAVAAAWALRTFVVAPYYVPSASMEPTLHGCSNCNDDHVLVEKLSYDFHDPEREDIVVFDNPGGRWKGANDKVLIKRVIGVPGDRLQIRDRKVYVNGQRLDESYVKKSCHGTTRNGMPSTYKVPKGEVYVMGDNRCNSEDSRMFGPVPINKVVGKAFLIFWPVGRFGTP